MDQADLNVPELKQPELKVSGPELVVESDGTSGALTTSALTTSEDCLEALVASNTEGSADLASTKKPESPQGLRLTALTTYMLENESQFYWLCASALLTWVGVWFHDTHGMLLWSSERAGMVFFYTSLLAPLFCVPFLFLKPNKFERPLLTIAAFFSLLFWNLVLTISCLTLMPFRFKGASRALGIAVLTGLQIGALCLFPFFGGPRDDLDRLQSPDFNLSLVQIKSIREPRCTLFLMQEYPLGPWLNFGKTHWRMLDTRSPESAVILPVDATHVAVLINRFSHYHRTVVDLTVKNLPIYVETMPAER